MRVLALELNDVNVESFSRNEIRSRQCLSDQFELDSNTNKWQINRIGLVARIESNTMTYHNALHTLHRLPTTRNEEEFVVQK